MTSTTPLSFEKSRSLAWQAVFIFLLALAVRWLGVSSNPVHVDELYHLIAGRSWAEEGTFRMLDGEYLRGRGFTALTGYTFALLGRSDLFVARLPSIIAGALLVSAIFLWLGRHTTLRAAWIGAMLFCFASYAIVYTQFTRFYALQALAIWLGSVSVYAAMTVPSLRKKALLSMGAAIAFLVALHLQVTTVIALMALMIWGLIDLAARPEVRNGCKQAWRNVRVRIALVAGLVGVAVIFGMFSGDLIHQFRFTPRWAAPDQNNFLYYFLEFFFSMPLLWLFLPLASVVAIAQWPRPALFCILMTAIPLILQSAGGMKSSRYVFYAFPFMFALWGMAGAVLLPALWKSVSAGVTAFGQITRWHFSVWTARLMTGMVTVMILGSAVVMHPIYRDTIKSLRKDAVAALHSPERLIAPPPDPPWSTHVVALREAIGNPSVLLVGDDFHAIHYLHDFDLLINTHRTEDIPPGGEFVLDPRTGRRAISTPENIARVIGCYSDGVIVVSDSRWRTYIGVSTQAADAIERLAQPISPGVPGFHLYKWHDQSVGASCSELHALVTGHRI